MNRKTKIKLSLSDRIFNAVNIFIMLVIAAVMLAPIIHVVCVSFSLGSEIQKGGLPLAPRLYAGRLQESAAGPYDRPFLY